MMIEQLIDQIEECIDYKYPLHYLGLRILPQEQSEYIVGDTLPPSYNWDTVLAGMSGREKLDGPSVIEIGKIEDIEHSDIEHAITLLLAAGYSGHRVALVRSSIAEKGQDRGESVFGRDNIIECIIDLSAHDESRRGS